MWSGLLRPPGLSVIFLWGGQQPGSRKNPRPMLASRPRLRAAETLGDTLPTGPLGFSETPP